MTIPKINDVVFLVAEHLYYPLKSNGRRGLVEKEYKIYQGVITEIRMFKGLSRKPEAVVLYGKYAGKLRFPKLSDFGKTVFFDLESAVELAEKMTDKYEKSAISFGEKLRRPWLNTTEDGKPYLFEKIEIKSQYIVN